MNIKRIVIISLEILIVVIILTILARRKDNQKILIGGDKDEGGCLIGAGYSWCPAKQKCLRVWEEACEDGN